MAICSPEVCGPNWRPAPCTIYNGLTICAALQILNFEPQVMPTFHTPVMAHAYAPNMAHAQVVPQTGPRIDNWNTH